MEKTKSVLIIDDEKMLREVLSEKFTEEGVLNYTAQDGAEGLKLALEKKPDLILLDIIMPGMDGIEVLRQLRQDAWGVHVPVTLLTNSNSLDTISKAVALDSTEYIVKTDVQLSEIVAQVKHRLGIQ